MFKNILMKIAVAAVMTAPIGIAAGSTAMAQEGLLEVCQQDIAKHCEGVTPGNGHIISCLYAREDQISAKCSDAFDDVGDVMDTMFSTVSYALATCAEDISKHCSGTKFGQGRLFSCLSEKKADIGAQCKAVVSELEDDIVN